MIFIGIVTDLESQNNISELLKKNNILNENNVIFINEKNIDNIKNVHFDTVIINREFKKIDELNHVLLNVKNIVINMDLNIDWEELNIREVNVITYGFNSKSSITISSVTDDDVLICIQRNINSKYGKIELQEIKLENKNGYNIYDLIMIVIIYILHFPSNDKIHINSIK